MLSFFLLTEGWKLISLKLFHEQLEPLVNNDNILEVLYARNFYGDLLETSEYLPHLSFHARDIIKSSAFLNAPLEQLSFFLKIPILNASMDDILKVGTSF